MTDTATKAPRAPRYSGPVILADVEQEPEVQSVRKGADLTAYRDMLTQSWNLREQNQPNTLGVTIFEGSRSVIESRFRSAAAEMGIGVGFGVKENHPGLQPGQVRLVFVARPKKERKPKENGAEKAPKAKGLPKP